MRIAAGSYPSRCSCDVILMTDRPLTIEQADVLFEAIIRAGATPNDVTAVEITEGGTIVEHSQRVPGAYPDHERA